MEAENRRLERRLDIIETLKNEHGFYVKNIIDMSYLEDKEEYLEEIMGDLYKGDKTIQ